MNAILLHRKAAAEEAIVEYNFFDNQFAPGNLVVRKIFQAMLTGVKSRLSHLEVEYNDRMLADRLGKRAGELLRFLGAATSELHEKRSGGVIISRTFRAALTPERYEYFFSMKDLSELPHYRLLEGEQERAVYFFERFLSLHIPVEEEPKFYRELDALQVPYKRITN